jgi:hypothetical protein
MTNDAGHLNSATAELFALSSTERIRAIDDGCNIRGLGKP